MFVSRLGRRRSAARARARGGDPRRGGRASDRARRALRRRRCPPCAPSRRRGASGARARAAIVSASPARIVPDRRAEALVEAERDRVDRRRELRERDAERDRGVREPRAVEVRPRRAAPRAPRLRRRRARCRRARVCVFSMQITSPPARRARRLEARDLRQPVALVDEDVRVRLDRDAVARLASSASSATRFASEHVGTSTAASLPSSSAPRRSSSLTLSSSP